MSSQYNLASSEFQSLKTASQRLFNIISEHLNVNTAYVTKRGEHEMTVLSSYNEHEEIIPEGYSVEYGGTYCRLIISDDNNAMTTENLMKDEVTQQLEVTSQLDVKGFLGVTLTDSEGNVFGTLCVMDKEEKQFSDEDIHYLKSMAEILSHLIELDQTKYNMDYLTVPIIPITQGISILTIQGIIDEQRSAKIINNVLQYGSSQQIEYFIIDLSGLVILDGNFPQVIIQLVQSLQLMGIETIITGISPEIAKHEVNNIQLLQLKTKTVQNLEAALDYIGFYLAEKD
ncbi:STAS domain-containing protein [Pontibacillus yanchengensis]|uniref:STAS domain-containing protein n=2 Tax=Pontibacillus yanchengensis TaxID=462910 RepID=A0ACC7VCB5_9BACI|nr:STAS domain-containing protein [Pontibacillus yanchengensis]MYL32472.1 STAS domain-containing protein [Pontibacillus yanchengensis]MYL53053.1 STAS domain-containing protein [Pontibacillus yanchengensis]